jgi:hypothetical protein
VAYPFTLVLAGLSLTPFSTRLDRISALVSGFIIFLVLWLYALPRDLAWRLGPLEWESRFVLPLSAYLAGLAVAAILMVWIGPTERRRS